MQEVGSGSDTFLTRCSRKVREVCSDVLEIVGNGHFSAFQLGDTESGFRVRLKGLETNKEHETTKIIVIVFGSFFVNIERC